MDSIAITAARSYAAQPVDHRLSSQRRVRDMLADRKLARQWDDMAPEAVQAGSDNAVATFLGRWL